MTIFFSVTGDYGPVVTDEIEEAFYWCIKELMPRKKNLDVTVEIKKLENDVFGYHWMEEPGTHIIELDVEQTPDDFFTALFHELVHVRQAERGIYTEESVPYYERPVEIEAYQLQEELLKKWKSSQQLH
mgnify:CR=1 FL=1